MVQVVTGLEGVVRLDLGIPSSKTVMMCIEEKLIARIAKPSVTVQGQ